MDIQSLRARVREEPRPLFVPPDQILDRFYAYQEYHLGWRDVHLEPADADPGKQIRPLMVLAAATVHGAPLEHAIPLAAAVQLFHDFTLLHDDIEDNSPLRRGRPTVWSLWGRAQGINTGDALLVQAHRQLWRLADVGVPAGVVLNLARQFDQTALQVIEGQFLDLDGEGRLDLNESWYLAMIRRKTAALFGGAFALGAMLGNAEEAVRSHWQALGVSLGITFQLHDDLLGIWGAVATTGKPGLGDLEQRKVTWPIIHSCATSSQAAAAFRQRFAQAHLDEAEIAELLDMLNQTDACNATLERAASETATGSSHLAALRALVPGADFTLVEHIVARLTARPAGLIETRGVR